MENWGESSPFFCLDFDRSGVIHYIHCGGTAEAVEKVKPDPLNLSVNTGAGKQSLANVLTGCFSWRHPFFINEYCCLRGDCESG